MAGKDSGDPELGIFCSMQFGQYTSFAKNNSEDMKLECFGLTNFIKLKFQMSVQMIEHVYLVHLNPQPHDIASDGTYTSEKPPQVAQIGVNILLCRYSNPNFFQPYPIEEHKFSPQRCDCCLLEKHYSIDMPLGFL